MPVKLTVAKIVSTATPSAWSQAYHAGGFTAVLSIKQKEESLIGVDESSLHKTGKELLDSLIAEYFTLITKDLHTVKRAVEASIEKLPKDIELSMVVGASVKNVLYIVIVNHGKALLKRGEKSGALLELDSETPHVESVSGYLENGDIVILQTQQFEEVLPQPDLLASIDHQSPTDLAEILSPRIHEAQNGGASAIIFSYQEEEPSFLQKSFTPAPPAIEEKEEHHATFLANENDNEGENEGKKEEQVAEEKETQPEPEQVQEQQKEENLEIKEEPKEESNMQEVDSGFTQPTRSRVTYPSAGQAKGVSHSQKIFLTIAIIIAVVLGSSIFFFLSKQEGVKRQQTLDAWYQPAKTKYEEGLGLVDLNKPLALSDFQQAKDMITTGESKLPKDSAEYKRLESLLTQINASIEKANQVPTIDTPKAADNASPLLAFMAKHTDVSYLTQDDTNYYAGDATGVTQYTKATDKAKQLIKNTTDWKQIGGLGTYLGNIYVLDKSDGIIKYVNGTTKQAYFADGTKPDLSNATAMAIDLSIWVLKSDGTILKFTRGKEDSFSVSGLDKAFSSPTSIVTSLADDNIYILDKGNSRVVVIKKSGTFVNQYAAPVIKNADGIDVDEKGKKTYVLSGGTIYQIDLK